MIGWLILYLDNKSKKGVCKQGLFTAREPSAEEDIASALVKWALLILRKLK